MLGLLILAVVCATIGLLIFFFYGPVWGIAIAILLFVVTLYSEKRRDTTGLFKSNLDNYSRFRKDGLSVDEALETMVLTRYSSEEQMQIQIKAVLSNLAPEMTEEEKVINAVFAVFCAEQGDPPVNLRLQYLDQIRGHYVRYAKRYNART